ncbi:prolipoprotein diacylglyceryl transferase [Mucilaginibacter sp. Bleaf8]|uniref:prolipoprotein diacylglyceryl transferase n=1 Tax=Mucilaginibacter sp. Bleaf8 TaxID=2834430 RepID=UPI001BCE043D|nr:prolipoprotein diacylglyceryl transferase family protein [Mucilaginibacter sp. Bleaf8]MBS7564738.1 prolipoprotein diacylglyceryl transferase [Mucilaginibacter sp. Bleaf8]
MFPTINDLLAYLFDFRVPFPVQTFGFFVAVAFWAAYQVFTAEFKRYEAVGKIHAFTKQELVGTPASVADIVVNFLLGFLLGYKAGGAIWQYAAFQYNPRNYVLSWQGYWPVGMVVGCLFALWVYIDHKKKILPVPELIQKTVHPYQLMGRIVLAVGVAGVLGSKLFDIIEHWELFAYNPLNTLFNSTGFAYYGGLIFGALTYLYIGHVHGMKLVHLADIGSPGMMLAYGVGRIGCQLAGDGDWGIINNWPKPILFQLLPDWMWSFRFPHNAINAGVPIMVCNGNYCNQLVQGVYPTSFYEAVLCIGFFVLMWVFRKSIITPGLMFFIYLVLNGAERFLIEIIRINHKYTMANISLTQAQFIGMLMIAGGLVGFSSLILKYKVLQNSKKLS